jgi:dCMP deaminase
MSRPDWDEYFLDLAKAAATRATCDRAQVGCILVKDNRVLSTGYNASISGHPHCDDEGHIIVDNSCIRAAHAEENAVVTAARFGISVADTTAYTTHFPCWRCFRMLTNAGVKRIVYSNFKLNNISRQILNEYLNSSITIEDSDGQTLQDIAPSLIKDGKVIGE